MVVSATRPPVVRDLVSAKVVNEQKVTERHARLVAAATELFLHQGFHKTTVRQIASAVGWHMGTLYLYISRKEDVLFLICQAIMAELWEGLSRVAQKPTARDSLEDAVRYYFGATNRKRREIKLLYRESASLLPDQLEQLKDSERKEIEFFAAIIKRGMAAGEFRRVDPELFAQDIIMLAHMWCLKGWMLYPKFKLDAYLGTQFDLILARLESPGANHKRSKSAAMP